MQDLQKTDVTDVSHERSKCISSFLTIDDLAEMLNVPKSWLYSRTRETGPDAIPRLKVGKYLRFEWDKVQVWLHRQNEVERVTHEVS